MKGRSIIHCGWLVDGKSDEPKQSFTVSVADGIVQEVTSGLRAPVDGEELIDWSDSWVIPGIVDCHDHLTMGFDGGGPVPTESFTVYQTAIAVRNAEKTLRAGITTMRDLGAKDSANVHLKRVIERGFFIGPDLVVAGHMICRTGFPEYPYCREADGREGLRVAVRLERKAGADVAKLMITGSVAGEGTQPETPEMRPEEVEAAIEEAHALGIKIAVHAYGGPAASHAIRAGVDTLEHGAFLPMEDLEEMARRGTWLIVTFGVLDYLAKLQREPEWLREKAAKGAARYHDTLVKVKAAGVNVAIGGDSYHGDPAAEMKALVDAGFSSNEALRALTINGAKVCGLEAMKGTVEAGKNADLVALAASPFDDPLNVRQVNQVMKAGRVYAGVKAVH